MTAPPDDRIAQLLAIEDPPWFAESIAEWLSDPAAQPLHIALGLDPSAHCLARRDYYLCEAWRVTSPQRKPWSRAMDLAAAVRLFATRVWPDARERDEPDPAWSTQRRNLWFAFRAIGGGRIPKSPEMIKEIVKSAGLYISEPRLDNAPEDDHSGKGGTL